MVMSFSPKGKDITRNGGYAHGARTGKRSEKIVKPSEWAYKITPRADGRFDLRCVTKDPTGKVLIEDHLVGIFKSERDAEEATRHGPGPRPRRVLGSAEKIIVAAATLPEAGFSIEELVVAAWRLDRQKFGMHGFKEDYPCSHRIASHVYDRWGLLKRKWLEKHPVHERFFKVTAAGRRAAAALGRMCA